MCTQASILQDALLLTNISCVTFSSILQPTDENSPRARTTSTSSASKNLRKSMVSCSCQTRLTKPPSINVAVIFCCSVCDCHDQHRPYILMQHPALRCKYIEQMTCTHGNSLHRVWAAYHIFVGLITAFKVATHAMSRCLPASGAQLKLHS